MNPTPLFSIVEGWTSPLDFQLLLNGAAFDATGMTLASIVRDKTGQRLTIPTSWGTIASAIARLSPAADTFLAAKGPYAVRFQVTDGTGKVAYFPQDEADHVRVLAP